MAPVSTAYSGAQYIEVKGIQKSQKSENLESSAVLHPEMAQKVDIIDIRHDAVEISLKDEILSSLNPQEGPKRLPTLLLYDERGLQLFEEVSVPR